MQFKCVHWSFVQSNEDFPLLKKTLFSFFSPRPPPSWTALTTKCTSPSWAWSKSLSSSRMTSPSCSRNSTSPSSRYAETKLFFTRTLMFMNCKLRQTCWVMQLINPPPLIWAHSLLGWLYETWSAVWMTYCPLYTSLSGRRYSILSAACLLCFLNLLLTVSIAPPPLTPCCCCHLSLKQKVTELPLIHKESKEELIVSCLLSWVRTARIHSLHTEAVSTVVFISLSNRLQMHV